MLLTRRRQADSTTAVTPRAAWVTTVTWIAVLAPLPYSLSRLFWAVGIPLGIEEDLLREFHSPGWGSLYILCLALLPEATALFAHTFMVPRRPTVPDGVPLFGGRRVRPALVVTVLLVPIVILTGFNAWTLGPIADGFVIPDTNHGLPGWSFWGQVATFWLWGVSLTIATTAYWLAAGDWNRAATGDHDPAGAA